MANKSELANRKSQIAAAAYVAFLLFFIATSPPRRVGDAGEYMAMTMNLAAFRPPSVSPSDLHRIERRFKDLGHGYEVVPLEMPALRGSDGRQDFPHFWLYPLLAVPPLWIVDGVGAHPNVAFAILNTAIASVAFLLIARRATPSIAILLFAGPMIWWIDKAHSDVFTLSLLAIGFGWLGTAPGGALIALGAAAAQNPPLAPVMIMSLAATMLGRFRPNPESRIPNPEPRLLASAVISLTLTALPVLYYAYRLGVPTPIVRWTRFHVPAVREVGAFIWDPNIGLAINNPIFVITVLVAALVSVKRGRVTVLTWWLPLACTVVLLAGFAQSVNINHGATPGMNRWTLWLMPLAVRLLMDVAQGAGRPSRPEDRPVRTIALGAAAIASTICGLVWFQPARGENYKTPTRTAQWIWSLKPGLDNPPPEVFTERVSGTEPPDIPIATADCRKVFIINGAWPVPCLPPLDPSRACVSQGSACYANAMPSGYAFVPVRFPAGLDFHPKARTWPVDDRFARNLRTALDDVGVQGLGPAAAGEPGAMLRAARGVPWTYALQAPDRLFVYVPEASAGAALTLRLPGPMGGAFVDLDSGERVTSVVRGGAPWAVWDVAVPVGRRFLTLILKSVR